MVNRFITKTFYLSCFKVNNICKLVIKYIEFTGIFVDENNFPKTTDIDA